MLEAGVHFGHQTRYWNPKMAEYIFGQRNQDSHRHLEKTMQNYQDAMKYVRQLASNRGTVLFVGTKRQRAKSSPTRRSAAACLFRPSRAGGMLTNFKTVKVSIKRLKDLEQMAEDGTFDRMTKREALSLNASRTSSTRAWAHQGHERAAGCDLRHRRRLSQDRRDRSEEVGIPLVAAVDTNHSPEGSAHVIPATTDSSRAIRLYARGAATRFSRARAR